MSDHDNTDSQTLVCSAKFNIKGRVCLSVYLSVSLPVCLPTCLSVCPSTTLTFLKTSPSNFTYNLIPTPGRFSHAFWLQANTLQVEQWNLALPHPHLFFFLLFLTVRPGQNLVPFTSVHYTTLSSERLADSPYLKSRTFQKQTNNLSPADSVLPATFDPR